MWKEEATAGHRGGKEAKEGRAGPCGDPSALLSPGLVRPPSTVMSAVENTKVEGEHSESNFEQLPMKFGRKLTESINILLSKDCLA